MRQLVYSSTSTAPAIGDALASILKTSRRNNAAAGVTGLLWTDGSRFIQALEGSSDDVGGRFAIIRQDPRHRDVLVLHDGDVKERTFGSWSMALVGDSETATAAALADAPPEVRASFEWVIAAGRSGQQAQKQR